MEFFQTYAKEIVSLFVPLITWLLNSAQRGNAKLIRGVRHAHTFLVNIPLLDAKGNQVKPNQLAHTASVVIHNVGNKAATNVELVFNFVPMCINFWPLRSKQEKTETDGRHSIIFESLAPNEFIGFELLSVNAELPALVNVRCDQGIVNEVQLRQYQAQPAWKIRLGRVLILIGMGAVAYMLLLLLQFLVLKTPVVIGG